MGACAECGHEPSKQQTTWVDRLFKLDSAGCTAESYGLTADGWPGPCGCTNDFHRTNHLSGPPLREDVPAEKIGQVAVPSILEVDGVLVQAKAGRVRFRHLVRWHPRREVQ